MLKKGKWFLRAGIFMMVLFAVWTTLIRTVDVQRAGQTETEIGFATFNGWFHELTGVHMLMYTITDWMGLVPVLICLLFGLLGVAQWIRRKSLLKVDMDLILLGIYYVFVILGYLGFERLPVNYRPIFIEGRLEASYPSSTVLLVLSVAPTLVFQANRRLQKSESKKLVSILTGMFSLFMVIGRLISGVHWFTDIVGSILLSMGLFCMYQAMVCLCCKGEN